MTREELIAALERAEGPSRELDRGIALSLGWAFDGNGWQEPDGTRHSGIDEYTASIDAALTLVPDGKLWKVDCWGNATVALSSAKHRHPAIALCIAALRARGETP